MPTDLAQNTSPTRQAEIEGWMVLVASPTHESNDSPSSEEEVNVTNKRKVRTPSPSPRFTKSPRVSASDVSVKSTRPMPFGTHERYSGGMTSVNQPNVTRTGASGSSQAATVQKSSLSNGRASDSFIAPGMTRPSDHVAGVSRVPWSIQRSSISASQPNATGSRLTSDKQKLSVTSSSSHTNPSASDPAMYIERSTSGSTRKAKAKDFDARSSSSDDLPDSTALLRFISGHTTKSTDKGVVATPQGKEIARRKLNVSSVAPITGFNKSNGGTPSSNSKGKNKSMVINDDVIIISSDSEVDVQLTVKKPKPRLSQHSSERDPGGSWKAKQQATKAFLTESDGAINLMSGPDMLTSTAAQRVGERRKSGPAEGQLRRAKLLGPTSSSSMTPRTCAPVPLHQRSSRSPPQTTGLSSPDHTTKRFIVPPAVNSSDRRWSSKAVKVSLNGRRKSFAEAEPSLADVISMSLGGAPSSSTERNKRAWRRNRSSQMMQRKSSFRPSSMLACSSQKPAPPVGAEIIDLCCDSDDAMNVEELSSETSPLDNIQSVAMISTDPQSVETSQRGRVPGCLSSPLIPPRESTPPIPTSSSVPDSSPSRSALTQGSMTFPENPDAAIPGDDPHSVETEYTEFLDATPLLSSDPVENNSAVDAPSRSDVSLADDQHIAEMLSGDAFKNNSADSSVHGATSRSSSSLIIEVASGSSNKEYRTRSPSSSLGGSQISKRRNSSAGSLAQDLVASVSNVHLHTYTDPTQQDNAAWPGEGDFTPHETIPEAMLAVNTGLQSSASERATSATSFDMDLSTNIRNSSKTSSGRPIQRARKTTRVDNQQVDVKGAEANRDSEMLETKAVETNNDPVVTSSSAGRVLAVKEPDFLKLRADIPGTLLTNDHLSTAIKWPAERVPIELHEMINCLPLNYHYNSQMKHIFESMMEENTADDEPTSPRIGICGRKGGPVTPPWEFYYTNRIFHGEGVPRSNKKALKGCDCIGPCNPKSKTCACVKKQSAWTGDDKTVKGFLYNRKGKLMDSGYPIFECNDACECSDDCMNRVIQHGRQHAISIVLTENKGWGVFADERIPRGTYLGIYSGEMILESEADERGKMYDKFGRTYLFDMDFYHLRKLDENKQKISDRSPSSQEPERFSSTYTIDAFHVGNFTRFLNHSCDPNCQITASYVNEPDLRKPMLTIYTGRDVRQGEELTFAYFGNGADEDNEGEVKVDAHGKEKIKVPGGPSTHQNQAIHRSCLCGAANCRGAMF